MSYKLTCHACDTYTSANFTAYENGYPCAFCGASLQPSSAQYYRQLPNDETWVDQVHDPTGMDEYHPDTTHNP